IVRGLPRSALDATLDTGGWLTLTRPGLSPGKIRQASWRDNIASEAQRVLCLRRANPAWRDWSRRAFGPQLSREHVRLHKIILDYG
ncbi:MAG: hypothetical protein MUP68_02640, partial [Deltaproteobacteria bacterium]|nr:hypothetical protein [Deltaproteobacteria bacterium]